MNMPGHVPQWSMKLIITLLFILGVHIVQKSALSRLCHARSHERMAALLCIMRAASDLYQTLLSKTNCIPKA